EVAAVAGLLVEVALLERTSRTARVRADVDGSSLDLGVGELPEHRRVEAPGQVAEGADRADVDMAELRGGHSARVCDRTDDGAGLQTLSAPRGQTVGRHVLVAAAGASRTASVAAAIAVPTGPASGLGHRFGLERVRFEHERGQGRGDGRGRHIAGEL